MARTQMVYVLLNDGLTEILCRMSTPGVPLDELCSLVQEGERLGSVHVCDLLPPRRVFTLTLQQTIDPSLYESLNAHLPKHLPDNLLQDFATNEWVSADFFDESSLRWPELALATLYTWVQSPSNPFRHTSSGTWRGGPNGVRWIVALIARLVTTFSLIDHGDEIPALIQSAVKPQEHKKNWTQLSRLTQMLIESLKRSNEQLAKTFHSRAQEWKAHVIKNYLTRQLPDAGTIGLVVPVTNGVPIDPLELQRTYEALTETDPNMTLGEDVSLQRMSVPHKPRRRPKYSSSESSAELSESDASTEGEKIEISLFSSEEDSSDPDDSVSDKTLAFAEESFRIGGFHSHSAP